MAAEPSAAGVQLGMQAKPDQVEAPGETTNGMAPDSDSKSKKAPTGARARSIKTPLQREALEAAYLINQFPAEEVRRALGDRIQLTENQVQVWFSHKRRKDKKTQQSTAASTPPATSAPSSTLLASLAAPSASIPQAAHTPVLASIEAHAAANTAAPPAAVSALPFSRLSAPAPSIQMSSSTTAVPAAASASIAPTASTAQPGHSAYIQQGSVQLPASLQLPFSHLNGNPVVPSRLAPPEAPQATYRGPAAEQVVRPRPAGQTQPLIRPEPHSVSQPECSSQVSRVITTQVPRQFLPHQYPPQSFLAAQQNARLGAGAGMSVFQPSLPVQASPARPAMTPMSIQTPSAAAVAAAAASSAPAISAAWSAGRTPLHVSAQLAAKLTGAGQTPSVGHFYNNQQPAVCEESEAGTEDMDTTPLTGGSHAEWQDLVEHAKSTLPVAYRSDGPQLAFIFDEPPSADGADDNDPDGPAKRKRVMVDGYEMEDDGEDGMNFKKARLDLNQIRRPFSAGKGGGSGAKEEAERRAYREAEKAQVLAKRVEQTMAKDKERMEREKKRVKEKLEREKKKDEVAQEKAAEKLRQLQVREAKKAAERAEKEKKAEERKRLQDEKRREKELLRALAAQDRQATRTRQRGDVNIGPKDDLDIEWEQLMEAHHQAGYGSGTEDQPDQRGSNLPERPEFPAPSLNLVPAFATDLPHKQGSDMLTVCAFLHSFTDLLGLPPVTLDNLLSAVVSGEQSWLLAEVHMAFLRLLQMDLEDAYSTGAIQGGGATNFMDRAIVNCAHALEEAWAWGFDVDVWRAHLNVQTWPEILRQYSIAMGLSQKRQKPRRGTKPKLGIEGEDVVKDEAGHVTLVVPARFGLGTVKGAAYKVLQDVGPEGLSITEIARRIQEQGLRDLTTSKTPEASVAGALSRDVIFARVAPATYCLQAIFSRHKNGNDANTVKAEVKVEDDSAADVKTEVKADPESASIGQEAPVKSEHHDRNGSNSESSSDDDEDEEGKVDIGESWLQHLKTHEYDELSFEQRVNILWTLMNLALDGPTVRSTLDSRTEEAQRIRKQMWEEARLEKKRRQQEAAEKAKKSAEEAQRALEAYNAGTDSPRHATSTPVHTADTNGSAGDPPKTQAERNAGASTSQFAAAHPHDHEDDMSSAAATKQRSQQRAETIRHAEEVNAVRGEPLGADRRHNRYWHFGIPQKGAQDPSLGRILVESHVDGTWRLLGQAHQIEHLMSSLERKGAREGLLHAALARHQSAIQLGMPAYSIQMPPTLEEQSQQERLRLYKEHHKSIWGLLVQALPYLQGSDPATGLPTHKGEASILTKLKTDMLRVEAALPLSAMKDATWNSDAWQAQVAGARSMLQLRQALGELEMAVHEGFLWQGIAQPRQPLAVKGAWLPIGQAGAAVEVQQPTEQPVSDPSVTPTIPASSSDSLAWLPATSAAISLRLFAIDAAIIYRPGDLPGREVIQRYAYVPRSASTPHVGAKNAEQTEARASVQAHSAGPSSHAPRSKPSSLFPPFPKALLQGPRQNFRLPVADFRQAVLDAQNGVAAPSNHPPSFKVRLPGSNGGLGSKPKSRLPASRTKPPGQSRNSLGNGKGQGNTASKASVHWQGHAEDMDLDIMPARSNTATPGPSDDDVQSPSRSAVGSDDEEPEISSEEEQQNNSDVELSD